MRRLWLLATLGLLAAPAVASAQANSCQLMQDRSGSVTGSAADGGVFLVRGVVIRCAGGAEIVANEGTIYQASGQTHLFGNVRFTDPEKRLTSQSAIYSSNNGRLHATGDVVYTDVVSGSTLRGPDVEYYRVIPGRPQPQVIATMRPTLTLRPEDGRADAAEEPVIVVGDRINIIGNNLTASGTVEIRQTQATGYADEAYYDRDNGRLNLTGRARMVAEQFTLVGNQIEARMPESRLESVVSRTQAVLTGEDLRVDASEIHLSFNEDRLERLVARRVGAGAAVQPVATSAEFVLRADSLDARMPGQRLERVVAVGNAHGETRDTAGTGPDAPLPPPAATGSLDLDRDWILGDTITGHFAARDTAAVPADTVVVLTRLVAVGSAKSLYHIEQNDRRPTGSDDAATPADRPARAEEPRGINYLVGDRIDLTFARGQVDRARVEGLQRGVYLDPSTPGAASPRAGAVTPAPS
jgi:lipopolysaccharide export system protein LptA